MRFPLTIRFSKAHLCSKLESTAERPEVMCILDAGNKLGWCGDEAMSLTSKHRCYIKGGKSNPGTLKKGPRS